MKKIFIALSVLAALIFSVAPSQALVGMPDDAPGCDAVWWFLVDFDYPTSGVNTLVVFTEVNQAAVNYEWTSYDIDSLSIADGELTGTRGDVFATDGYSLLQAMSPNDRKAHEIDLDDDGVNDHWAGYIYFDKIGDNLNNVVGQTLLVNIPRGVASMCNVPMKEYNEDVFLPDRMTDAGMELFSADALAAAQGLQEDVIAGTPTSFSLYPRYMQVDTNSAQGQSMLIVWKSEITPDIIHLDWWNDEEENSSTNLNIDHELNFIDIRNYIPDGLFAPGETWKEGWFEFIVDDVNAELFEDEEWLAWTWHAAYGPASDSWSVLAPVARDVEWE
ncbi:MAG: hypothetical protein ACQEQ7_13865 [Thermodesulfobacteriota bacterium]